MAEQRTDFSVHFFRFSGRTVLGLPLRVHDVGARNPENSFGPSEFGVHGRFDA